MQPLGGFNSGGAIPKTGYSSANGWGTGIAPKPSTSGQITRVLEPKVPTMSVAPTTPLKSTVVAHPDGTQITQNYHPEETGTNPGMITPTVPGTQRKLNGETNPYSRKALGTPTQSNNKLQGAAYFNNLATNPASTPAEKQAGLIWQKNNPSSQSPTNGISNAGTSDNSGTESIGASGGGATTSTGLTPLDITQPISPENGGPSSGTPATPPVNPIAQTSFLDTLANQSQNASPEYTNAYNTAQDYAKQLADLKKQEAETYKNVEGTAGFMPQATGIEGVANRYFAGKEGAINAGYQGASNLISGANTQQGLQQGAAVSGAGLTAPTTQFGVLTNPQTGQPISGGTPQSAAFSGGQTQASVGLGSTYANNDAALRGAQNQVQSLTGIDITNQTNIPLLTNLFNQWENEGVSSPNYQKLTNTLSAINSSYSQVLGYPVDVSNLAKSSGKTIGDVLKNLSDLATQKQAGLKSAGTGQTSSSSSNTSGGSTGGGLYGW